MHLDYLDRYIWEAEAHANELLEVFGYEGRKTIAAALEEDWNEFLPQFLNPPKAAFVFLGENPAARELRFQKLTGYEAVILWAQARFLALRAARSMRLAASVADVKGLSYRKAARKAAEAASRAPGLPRPRDIALLELPD
ncbi:hypothetical protein [Salipiger marinus]|uniref:hypothetical protein n=1 Tax=Salipiger marinus TaxID=555512 RepID=UPI004058E71D